MHKKVDVYNYIQMHNLPDSNHSTDVIALCKKLFGTINIYPDEKFSYALNNNILSYLTTQELYFHIRNLIVDGEEHKFQHLLDLNFTLIEYNLDHRITLLDVLKIFDTKNNCYKQFLDKKNESQKYLFI